MTKREKIAAIIHKYYGQVGAWHRVEFVPSPLMVEGMTDEILAAVGCDATAIPAPFTPVTIAQDIIGISGRLSGAVMCSQNHDDLSVEVIAGVNALRELVRELYPQALEDLAAYCDPPDEEVDP